MALLKSSRSAQWPLVQEFVLNFDDTMVDIGGTTRGAALALLSNADLRAFPMPPGAVLIGGEIVVETAFVGPTAATISVGDTNSATRHASAVDLKTAARTALTLTGYRNATGDDILIRLNTTVAVASAGKVTVRVMYTVAGRSCEVQVA